MCGRARCTLQPNEVLEAAGVAPEQFINAEKYHPVENLGPGRYIPVICGATVKKEKQEDGTEHTKLQQQRTVRAMRWGLIPSFTKPHAKPDHFIMFNARAQSLQERPAFRRLVHTRRCVVLCEGFYEWQQVDKKEKQPYYLFKTTGPMKFAGLYDTWKNDQDEEMYSVTILTTDIAPQLKWLHTRMPVILTDEGVEKWLSSAKFESLTKLLVPYTGIDLKWHAVDRKVGSTRYQSEDCSKKVDVKHAGNIKSFFGGVKAEKKEPSIKNQVKEEPTPRAREAAEKNDIKTKVNPEAPGFMTAHEFQKQLNSSNTSPTKKRPLPSTTTPSPSRKSQKVTKSTPTKGTLLDYFQRNSK